MQIALRKNAVIILCRSDSASLRLDIFIHVHENFVLGACCSYCSALLHFKQWTKHILLHRSKGIKKKNDSLSRERECNIKNTVIAECNGIFMEICAFDFDSGIRVHCRRGKQAISTLMMRSSSSWFYQFLPLHSLLMHFIQLDF